MPNVDAPIRHVAFDPAAPVAHWSAEVIEAVLDRGSLSDWRLIAREIRSDPWGGVARTVETIVSWGEHYGVDALMRTVIDDARARVDDEARARYATALRTRRLEAQLSLRELASMAGTSASRLSAYENGQVAPTVTVYGRLEHILDRHTRRGP